MATEPWGWTATIYITIEGKQKAGDAEALIDAAKVAADRLEVAGLKLDHVGVAIGIVDEKPVDQVAT